MALLRGLRSEAQTNTLLRSLIIFPLIKLLVANQQKHKKTGCQSRYTTLHYPEKIQKLSLVCHNYKGCGQHQSKTVVIIWKQCVLISRQFFWEEQSNARSSRGGLGSKVTVQTQMPLLSRWMESRLRYKYGC